MWAAKTAAGAHPPLVYVTMLVMSAGVAVWAISAVFGWSGTPEYGGSLVPWLHYLLRFLTSFVAAYGFAMLFNSPQRVCATAALIGAQRYRFVF